MIVYIPKVGFVNCATEDEEGALLHTYNIDEVTFHDTTLSKAREFETVELDCEITHLNNQVKKLNNVIHALQMERHNIQNTNLIEWKDLKETK